jgi:septum formation protein
MIDISPYKLVLGSKSPRRCELLSEAGFSFEIVTEDTDESFDASMPVIEVAEMLAYRKADAILPKLSKDSILITADSVVILDDVIYNKPADYEEAFAMLRKQSGRRQTVATGVCICSHVDRISFTSITYVDMGVLSDDEIDYYISKFEPYDKAGGYGIQDWIGRCKISGIEGSYPNVMGLPMHDVYHALKDFLDNAKRDGIDK